MELRRLQHVPGQTSETGTVVVAIGDGEDAHRTAEIAREHELRFALIPDPDRRISRQYGINCWPTIVSINENGIVDFVHSGITHTRKSRPITCVQMQNDSGRFESIQTTICEIAERE
jgi:AhpC/TSA family